MKTNEKGGLRLHEKIGYGLSYFGVEMLTQFNSYLTYFMTNVLGLSMGAASTITGLNTLWNAVNDPLLGNWADNRKFKNGDKVRPFWLYCCLPMALFCVLMYAAPEMSLTAKAIWVLVAYFFYDTFSTLITIPNYGMIVLMTDKPTERTSLSVWAMVLDTIGIALYALAMPLIHLFAGGTDEAGNLLDGRKGFILTCCIYSAIFVISSLCAYFSTRERIHSNEVEVQKMSIVEIVRTLLREKNWILNTLFMLGYSLISGIVTGYLYYYTQYVLHNTGLYTLILVCFLLCNIIGSPLAKLIDSKIGHRKTMLAGAVLLMIARIPSMIAPASSAAVFINAAVMGFGMAFSIVMINVVQAETVDLIEWKQKKSVVASASSVRSFVYKGSMALAMFAVGQVLAATGYDAELVTQPDATVNMLCACLSYIPFVFAALMFVIAFFLNIESETVKMKTEKASAGEN